MTSVTLLQWHYLIFLLPLGVSMFLLVLSVLRGGRHGGHRMAHGHHAGGHTASTGGHAGHRHHVASTHRGTGQGKYGKGTPQSTATAHTNPVYDTLVLIFGIGRIPMAMQAQLFGMFWGTVGLVVIQALLPGESNPPLMRVLPSMGLAVLGGGIGARLSSEVLARLMPPVETAVVSRDGLYGMVGRVVFPVDEKSGRVHVYDENRTLHDERCRVAAGHRTIGKGKSVMVMDRDIQGILVVEEVV